MNDRNTHYRQMVRERSKTRFARCGYNDRFDPFILNKNERIRQLYDGLFRTFIGNEPGDKLLDIGCGTGIYFDVLANYANEVHSLDLSEDMVAIAREYCEANNLDTIQPEVGSAEALNYPDNLFDKAIAFDLMHHVSNPRQAIDEVHRVLRPGGLFMVFEPNIYNPLMFLAHAIPKEERLALRRNGPDKLVSILEKKFETVQWKGVCAMVTQCEGIRGFLIDAYLWLCRLSGIEKFYTRQVWLGRKR